MDFDTSVKMSLYARLAESGRMPTAEDVAGAMQAPKEEVLAAFERLHQKRLLVPEPGDPQRIRMAPPFSGIETEFRVLAGGKIYYANCAWDSLGVPAALHQDALIQAADAHSGEAIQIQVRGGKPIPTACVIHFAVPAAKWWQDIIYT